MKRKVKTFLGLGFLLLFLSASSRCPGTTEPGVTLEPLNINLTATPNSGYASLKVSFQVGLIAGVDRYNAITSADYDFNGDGKFDLTRTNADGIWSKAEYTYTNPGVYTVKVRVTDASGNQVEATTTVTVSASTDTTRTDTTITDTTHSKGQSCRSCHPTSCSGDCVTCHTNKQ